MARDPGPGISGWRERNERPPPPPPPPPAEEPRAATHHPAAMWPLIFILGMGFAKLVIALAERLEACAP